MYLNTVWLWISPAASRLRLTADSELPDFTLKATVCPFRTVHRRKEHVVHLLPSGIDQPADNDKRAGKHQNRPQNRARSSHTRKSRTACFPAARVPPRRGRGVSFSSSPMFAFLPGHDVTAFRARRKRMPAASVRILKDIRQRLLHLHFRHQSKPARRCSYTAARPAAETAAYPRRASAPAAPTMLICSCTCKPLILVQQQAVGLIGVGALAQLRQMRTHSSLFLISSASLWAVS